MRHHDGRHETLGCDCAKRAKVGLQLLGAIFILAILAGSGAVAQSAPGSPDPSKPFFVSTYDGGERSWKAEAEVKPAAHANRMAMYEVTQYPQGDADAEQQRRADKLRQRSLESARKNGWFDFTRGLADGYQLMFADAEHYVNPAYVFDDRILDPERPEFLMYYETSRGPKLAGYMFLTRQPQERGPQVGGPLTVWHYHIWHRLVCLERGMFTVGAPGADGSCAVGTPAQRSPEMLHVWFVDHPRGPFATGMRLSADLIAKLAQAPSGQEGQAARWQPPAGFRFKTRWDGTAYDRQTGLIWEVKEQGSGCARCVDDQYSWTTSTNNPDGTAFSVFLDRLNNTCNGDGLVRCTQAADCANIGDGLCGLGGLHDWRLPTFPELRGLLLEKQACRVTPCVDQSLPGVTRPDIYWSASPDPSAVATAAFVHFADGQVGGGPKAERAYVRAVRGFSAANDPPAAAPPAAHHHDH